MLSDVLLFVVALTNCNAVIYGVNAANISRLQRTQNHLARVVCKALYCCSATNLIQQLHWLPVNQRIEYNILTIVYSVRHRLQPKYLLDLLTDYVPPRTLRSSYDDLLTVPSNIKTVTASRAFPGVCP